MKRIFASLLLVFSVLAMYAQQKFKVSTSEEKKTILLEEFTGVTCPHCPEGHIISEQLVNGYDGRVILVNLHAGPFSPSGADHNFTTKDGDSLAYYFNPTSFPCAMINRHPNNGKDYLTERNDWYNLMYRMKDENAPVNLYLEGTYDDSNRELSVHVEAYSTQDNSNADMRINVLVTQDYMVGLQFGELGGENYVHMNVLRDYLTAYDGNKIASMAEGDYFSADYSAILPEEMHGKEFVPGNLNIVAFVTTNGITEVANSACVKPVFKNLEVAADAEIIAPDMPVGEKYGFKFFEAKVRNKCSETVTSATFDVNINGKLQQVEAECNIAPFCTGDVKVPCSYDFKDGKEINYEVKLTAINGKAIKESSLSGAFKCPEYTGDKVKVVISTDRRAWENEFALKDEDGNVIKVFGPYPDNELGPYEENIVLEEAKTYCIEVYDRFGNGMLFGRKGSLITYDAEGKVLHDFKKIDGFGVRAFFMVNNASGIDNVEVFNQNGDKLFSINGVRLNETGCGEKIIIKNGKKYINK